MNLIISSELTAPKSEVSAFRTLTLYASIFKNMDCFVECKNDEIDFYYNWLKRNYAYDFIKDMVKVGEIKGVRIIYNNRFDELTFDNLNKFILIVNLI